MPCGQLAAMPPWAGKLAEGAALAAAAYVLRAAPVAEGANAAVCGGTIGDCPDIRWSKSRTGKCYLKVASGSHAECASCICETLYNASLPTIESEWENALVNEVAGGAQAWIGLYQDPQFEAVSPQSGWDLWASGCSASWYRNWDGEPDDGGGASKENCAYMLDDDSGLWQDGDCSTEMACICQWPAQNSAKYIETVESTHGEPVDCPTTAEIAGSLAVVAALFVCCCCGCGCLLALWWRRCYTWGDASGPSRSVQVHPAPGAPSYAAGFQQAPGHPAPGVQAQGGGDLVVGHVVQPPEGQVVMGRRVEPPPAQPLIR